MSKVSYTAEEAGAHIIRDGHSWGFVQGAPVEVTYAFRLNQPTYDNSSNIYGSFSQFNAVQVAATTTALDLWSDVANITFTSRADVAGDDPFGDSATILFANYAARDGAGGFAYLPSPSRTDGSQAQGDIWINRFYGLNQPEEGDFANFTLIHEIGHAIGLEHPGHYDALDGQPITYENSAEYVQDSRQYSVMSYFGASFTGADHDWNYARTPLMHDIVALQMLYGANYETRGTDTVYGFNSNAGESFSLESRGEKAVFSIWDGGGEDTLDFSGYRNGQKIDLREESFSSVGGLDDNVSIAPGVTIENAKGGTGSDSIIGNAADNDLRGISGNDTLRGLDGNDDLRGGGGRDRLYGDDGDDQLRGASGRDVLVGGEGNDVLLGGSGNDRLVGGAGDDLLQGGRGRDALYGGAGSDVFDFDSIRDSRGRSRDSIQDFDRSDDLIDLSSIDARSGSGNQAFDWIGRSDFSGRKGELHYEKKGSHVMVEGDINGDGKADFQILVKNLSHLSASDFDL